MPPSPTTATAASPRRRLLIVAMLVAGTVIAVGAYRHFERKLRRGEALASAAIDPPEMALPRLLPLLEESPDDWEVLQAVVATQQRAGVPPDEIEPYSARWMALRPEQSEALEAHLSVVQALNRPAGEVMPVMERLAALHPRDLNRRAELAAHLLRFGRSEEALEQVRPVLEAAPNPPARLLAAQALTNLGRLPAAAAELDKLIADHPEFVEAIVLQATIQQTLGNHERVVPLLKDVRTPDPFGRIPVLDVLGRSYSRLNRTSEAAAVFDELARLQVASHAKIDAAQHPLDAARQLHAATSMMKAGMTAPARAFLDAALERIGPNRELLLKLAECHDQLGDAVKARSIRAALP